MNRSEVKSGARAMRLRIAEGKLMSIDEARRACLPRAEAFLVFDNAVDDGEHIRITCCGVPANISDGILGSMVRCDTCKAEARDATSPMYSPLLERGNSFFSLPSPEWIESFGEYNWIVTHEGKTVCRQCGSRVELEREDYATPICFSCLPPPKPLPIRRILP